MADANSTENKGEGGEKSKDLIWWCRGAPHSRRLHTSSSLSSKLFAYGEHVIGVVSNEPSLSIELSPDG